MPGCLLYCERCGGQQVQPLGGPDFGLLLVEGVVEIRCPQCNENTRWKLVLLHRREPPKEQPPGPRRLLVIDDDPDTLRVLQKLLAAEHTVETAISADEALDKLQTADFDVIIADILMPNFDGRSLYRFLAVYLPDYIDRVVFLTADRSEKTLTFLKESGCPYTFKPIDLPHLQACIREVG